MAQDFRNTLNRVKGTSPFTILAGGDYDAVIGIRCCNVLTTSITVDVYIVKAPLIGTPSVPSTLLNKPSSADSMAAACLPVYVSATVAAASPLAPPAISVSIC